MRPSAPTSTAAETLITVRSPEIDSFGHVNHAVFLNYLEHARYEALESAGLSWPLLAELNWRIFVVRMEVDYLAEAKRGDELVIRTWAERFRRTTMVLAQEILRGDDRQAVVARAQVTAVWIGPNRRPMRVPEGVREGLQRRGAP
jgi:acyl-CoA thioester hydrolase